MQCQLFEQGILRAAFGSRFSERIDMMNKKGLCIAIYFLIPILMIASIVFSPMGARMGMVRIVGLSLGIVAYFMMCAQVVLAARIPFLDRTFALDRLIRFHAAAGTGAFVLALLHPLVLHQGLFSFRGRFGEDALLLFFITIVLALFFLTTVLTRRLGWARAIRDFCAAHLYLTKYHVQLWMHHITILAVLFMFLHVVFRFRGFGSNLPFTVLAVAVFVAAAASYLWHMVLRPSYRYHVKAVRNDSKDMTTLILEPSGHRSMTWKAGQFGYVRLSDPAVSTEWHPFSISAAPGEDLTFTIRNLGDWTSGVSKIQEGSQVRVDGPYGKFTPKGGKNPLILIAGGVGITPMTGIVKDAVRKGDGRPMLLFWCARSEEDLIDAPLWEKAKAVLPRFTLCQILSRDDAPSCEKGRFSNDIFRRYTEKAGIDVSFADVYYCGPEPLRETVHKVLGEAGIPADRIHEERFSL